MARVGTAKSTLGTVLILGADGFIGRHLAFELRSAGWHVIAHARSTGRLAAMGFNVLRADLTSDEAARVKFWRPHLKNVTHVVNAAGVLAASETVYRAVHVTAPKAVYEALPEGAEGVLISAVSIDEGETGFAKHRLQGEDVARNHGLTILRAGLVLGDTSYGGSSLARGLAVLPFRVPVVGDGIQQFNPIHAADLAKVVDHFLRSPDGGTHEIGGPEVVSQGDMLQALRGWMGFDQVPKLCLPISLCDWVGRVGDFMRLGPISRTAVQQLHVGVLANTSALQHLPAPPRGFTEFLNARPAGTQDVWHARFYLLRPVLRMVLVMLWLVSGLLGLFLPSEDFLPLVAGNGLSDTALVAMARLGGLADLALAAAILRGFRPIPMLWTQAALVVGYTFAFTVLAPMLWLLPLGGLLKNIPILALFLVVGILEKER